MLSFSRVIDSQEKSLGIPEYREPQHLKKELKLYSSLEIVPESANF